MKLLFLLFGIVNAIDNYDFNITNKYFTIDYDYNSIKLNNVKINFEYINEQKILFNYFVKETNYNFNYITAGTILNDTI